MAATERSLVRGLESSRPFVHAKARAALLSLLLGITGSVSACTLEAAEGDGLYVADAGAPFGSSQSPITGTPSGGTTGGVSGTTNGTTSGGSPSARACVNVAGFTMKATPLLVRDCARCHNGTKGKATQLLDLTLIKDMSAGAQQTACAKTLTTTDPVNASASTIFTFVDPSNAATVHDFKYATPAEFTAFRDGVLAWLETE